MLGGKWRGEGGKVNGWGMFGMSCKHCLEVYHCRRLVYTVYTFPQNWIIAERAVFVCVVVSIYPIAEVAVDLCMVVLFC